MEAKFYVVLMSEQEVARELFGVYAKLNFKGWLGAPLMKRC